VTVMALLEVNNVSRHFGGLAAVNKVDLTIDEGEILGLIGPNGAGKSTMLNLIDGTLRVSAGKITFQGQNITRYPPHRRTQLGMARVFQKNALFRSMTVLENVIAGSYLQTKHGPLGVIGRSFEQVRKQPDVVSHCMELLGFVGLADSTHELCVNLPHGKQRELCVAVALASEPALLLLDEPLTGMNAEETASMIGIIKNLNATRGTTVIVVEHNVRAVLGLCGRSIVLNYGRKLVEGTPHECVADPAVIEAYLGTDSDVA
jgi:branched-chain amino acid transport system ATP-binding protein